MTESARLFVESGLRKGEAVVMVAPVGAAHAYLERVQQSGLDPRAAQQQGRLAVVDVETLIEGCVRDGVAVWSEFRECMGTVLQSVGASAPQATRVYSEAVSVLWGRDQGTAAVLIEKFWNDLRKEYRFSVFCGYRVDALDPRSYQGPVANVGRAHTDVLPTPDEDRLKAAIDAASQDVLGAPLSATISFSGRESVTGEHRIPPGHRTILWITRHMPDTSARILERARQHYLRAAS